MIGAGINMRTGPICRNVADAARILDVIAGYDPKDEMTVWNIPRKPPQPYLNAASTRSLNGMRIGVIREYMSRKRFAQADEESIALTEQALTELKKLGATVVDPGPEGELFHGCIASHAADLLNASLVAQFPDTFAGNDPLGRLLSLRDPSQVPQALSLRNLRSLPAEGEDRYMINRYLQERGDANIKSNADLISKARFYQDPNFPDRKQARQAAERATRYDTTARLASRVALQNLLLQCMREQNLDALVSPTSTVPPRKLTSPREPTANGRPAIGWFLIGQQGFPAITVPAGFTRQVWDREHDGNNLRMVGPIDAHLPVGVDFIARPFEESVLVKIASAYEGATHHRRPPSDFGPLAGEP
jgi:amidase